MIRSAFCVRILHLVVRLLLCFVNYDHIIRLFSGLGVSKCITSKTFADPQSAQQTNVILVNERNKQPNAIFEGEKLSVSLSASLSVSLADPQSAKQTNVILMKERNGQPNERV